MKNATMVAIAALIAPSVIAWGFVAYQGATRAPQTLYKGAFEQSSNYYPEAAKDAQEPSEAPATTPIAARGAPARKAPAKPPSARRASECFLHALTQGGSPDHPFVVVCESIASER